MIFAAFADVHGNSAALDAVLADITRRGINDIVNLGDSLSGPLDPGGTAERLMDLGLPTVRGNHDRALEETDPARIGLWERWTLPEITEAQRGWAASLPERLTHGEALLCHATPGDDATNWLDERGEDRRMHFRPRHAIERLAAGETAPLMLCGHTHVPRMVRLGSGSVVVNPGSVGCPSYLDDREATPFIAETGAPDARYAICEKADGQWTVSLVSVAYDAQRMVDLALAKGADSWAEALTTGWFTAGPA